jgi:hypothetical protein
MIERFYIQKLSRLDDLPRDENILGRGGWIAARVVMGDDHGGGIEAQCFFEHLADADHGGIHRATVDFRDLQQPIFGVKARDPQLLLVEGHHLGHEELGDIGRRLDLEAVLVAGDGKATPNLQCSLEACGLAGRADTGGDGADIGTQQANPAVVLAQAPLADRKVVLTRDQREQLGVVQRRRAAVGDAARWLFAEGKLADTRWAR